MSPSPQGVLIYGGNGFLNLIWALLSFAIFTFAVFVTRRRKTRLQLSSEKCGLPTVCWMPRFVNYLPEKDEKKDIDSNTAVPRKMPSSNITNILPRMERLGGPYGMYATVYGVSTKVVHVAHPIPAKAILTGNNSLSAKSKSSQPAKGKNRSSIAEFLGAIKSPAYDHFKNFSGDGVFTADGKI